MPEHRLLFLTLLGAACGGGSHTPPATTPPPATFDLLFDREGADGTRSLWRARLDGSAPEPVPGGSNAVRPHARGDGQAIVFTSQPTAPLERSQVMWVDAAGAVRRLSIDPAVGEREAVFHPDGERIAFVSERDEPGGADVFVARVRDGALTDLVNLTPGAAPGRAPDVTPAWSPDGQRLAFTSYRVGGTATLWTMRADGSDPRQLTQLPGDGESGDHYPVWSPDGRYLAFQRRTRNVYRIGLVPAAGGQPAFFDFAGRAYAPAWSPDGRWIAFVGEIDGSLDLHLQPTAAATPPLRLALPGADRNPAFVVRR